MFTILSFIAMGVFKVATSISYLGMTLDFLVIVLFFWHFKQKK